MNFLAELFFPCDHSRVTWPQRDRKSSKTTVSCLSCGGTFLYDFDTMEMGAAVSLDKAGSLPDLAGSVGTARPVLKKREARA